MRPIALRSPPPTLIGIVSAADHRSALASLPFGSLFLEPLGTKCYVASKHGLQSNDFRGRTAFFLRIVDTWFVTLARLRL